MATDTTRHTREVAIDSLVIDSRFAGLFIEEPATIARIAKDMRATGYDPHRPIDVWKNGAGRGKHIVVEGHQRLAAARAADLRTVRIAYRDFDDDARALLWAAGQQANRRNATREAQCLSIMRTLERAGRLDGTRAEIAERFGFGNATVGRAMQVLGRGTESEIAAVLDGTHSLKSAYERILERERRERQHITTTTPVGPEPEDDPGIDAGVETEAEQEAPEWLAHARDLTHTLAGRVDRVLDVLAGETADVSADVAAGRLEQPLASITGLLEDLAAAVEHARADTTPNAARQRKAVRARGR